MPGRRYLWALLFWLIILLDLLEVHWNENSKSEFIVVLAICSLIDFFDYFFFSLNWLLGIALFMLRFVRWPRLFDVNQRQHIHNLQHTIHTTSFYHFNANSVYCSVSVMKVEVIDHSWQFGVDDSCWCGCFCVRTQHTYKHIHTFTCNTH